MVSPAVEGGKGFTDGHGMGIYVDVYVDGDFHILFFYFHFQLLLFYTVIPPVVLL